MKSNLRNQNRKGEEQTGHELESVKSLAFVIGDNLVRLRLLSWAPILNVVQNVNPRRVLCFDPQVLFLTQDGLVHCGEVDNWDGERAVHVKDDASQPRPRSET